MARHHLAALLLLALALPLPAKRAIHTSATRCLAQPALVCNLRPTPTNTAIGRVLFTPVWRPSRRPHPCLVHVSASVSALSPGRHGFHIHTYGDLSAPDATSAGGHFTNPRADDLPHGYPGSPQRHWGDFANLIADGDGTANYSRVDKKIGLFAIRGRGMIVHETADYGPAAQPSGNAGPRHAACVIGVANPDFL